MKKQFLLLLICLYPLTAIAQMTLLEKADDYRHDGKYQQSLVLLKKLVKKEPNNYKVYLSLGLTYSRLKKKKDKEQAYQKAVEVAPLEPVVYYRYGDFLWGNKRLAEARDLYIQGIQKIPGDAQIYYLLGNILNEMKEEQKAIQAFTKAIQLNPQHDHYYFSRAYVYGTIKDYTKALADYDKSLKLKPDKLTYSLRADLRFKTHDYAGALADYQEEARLEGKTIDVIAYRTRVASAAKIAYYDWQDKDIMKAVEYAKEGLK